jgi:hypothetical protein
MEETRNKKAAPANSPPHPPAPRGACCCSFQFQTISEHLIPCYTVGPRVPPPLSSLGLLSPSPCCGNQRHPRPVSGGAGAGTSASGARCAEQDAVVASAVAHTELSQRAWRVLSELRLGWHRQSCCPALACSWPIQQGARSGWPVASTSDWPVASMHAHHERLRSWRSRRLHCYPF